MKAVRRRRPAPGAAAAAAPDAPFPDYRPVAVRAVEAARKAGASAADAYVGAGRKTSVKIRKGEIEELTQAGSKAMGIRVLVDGRGALLYTSDFSEAAIARLAADAVELARQSGADPFAGLPPAEATGTQDAGRLQLFDASMRSESLDTKIEWARRCEAAASRVSKKIKLTQGTGYYDVVGTSALATSTGFVGSSLGSACGLHTVPIAVEKGKRQTDHWASSARFLADLDSPEEVGRIAAERSLARLGGSVPATGEMPVVFDPPSAAAFISHIAEACFGSAVFREASFLKERLGEQVAPEDFMLVDDPSLPRRLGSRAFDGEGLPARRNVLIEKGKLKRFLTDSYSARKLKKPLTGSAYRDAASPPGVGTSNLYLAGGKASVEQILASIDKGVYVTSFMGHGVNLVTGDYSRGATGFMIENGKLGAPIQGFTIAGNLATMLRYVCMIGCDLCFRDSTNAPTIKIRSMMVGGR